MEQSPTPTRKRPPTPGSWKPGQSGNVRGRPRKGHALAEAVRAGVEPEELVGIAVDLARAGESEATRISALTWLRDSGYQRPAERTEIAMAQPETDDDVDLSGLSLEQLRRLAQLEAERDAILSGALGATPGGVIDIGEQSREVAAPVANEALLHDRDPAGLAR